MILRADSGRARLKHHGRRIVVREKYQRPEVKDLGTKWRMVYWDYSSKPRRKRSKVWGKRTAPSKRDAQRNSGRSELITKQKVQETIEEEVQDIHERKLRLR